MFNTVKQSIADHFWLEESPDCVGTAHRLTAGQSNLTIRATVTKRRMASETGNLCAQQLQIGPLWCVPRRGRVEGLNFVVTQMAD